MSEHRRSRLAGALGIGLGLSSVFAASLVVAQEPVPTTRPPAPAAAEGGLQLRDLIDRALQTSPSQQVVDRGMSLAEAERVVTRASLMPQLGVAASQLRQTSNPAALGFQFPGIPSLIGPYSVFDARVSLSQTLFDLAKSSELASAGFAVDAARAQVEVQREQLATQVALAFIRVLAGEQALVSAQTDLKLAEDLMVQARDQRTAGLASGVDVSRAETAVAQDRYAVSEAQTSVAQARLQLQRLVGLPMGEPLQLAGQLQQEAAALADAQQVLSVARQDRAELALLQAQLDQANEMRRAAKRRVYPTVSAFADYGLSANEPGKNEEDTYRYGARVELPLYAGGAIRAGNAAAELQVEQQRLRLADLQEQVEQDVRLAVVTVANTREQITAADAAFEFAGRELELTRDRFLNGIANNIDVVNAQANLARARTQVVSAQAAHQQARVNLAAAQGHARQFKL